jgi:hypothetical protein
MFRKRKQETITARIALLSRWTRGRRRHGRANMFQRMVLGGATLLLLVALGACGGTGSTVGRLVTQKQIVDRLTIALEAPAQTPLLAEQELVVDLTDQAGQPIDGAEVWLALVMPTMQHSPNEPDAVADGPGRYKAKALFTMVGNWNIQIHATVHGQEYIATFHAPVT